MLGTGVKFRLRVNVIASIWNSIRIRFRVIARIKV